MSLLVAVLGGVLAPVAGLRAQVAAAATGGHPGIVWSTVLGGSSAEDGYALARIPGTQDVIVASTTSSPDFPATPGALDTTFNGDADAYVARLSSDGSQLVWATFIGGAGSDSARAVAVLPSGEIIVGGLTDSPDFPTTAGAFNTTGTGGFVLRLDASGASLRWSTFVPSGRVQAVALAGNEEVVVGGFAGAGLPTTTAAFDTSFNGGPADAFAARLLVDGSGLAWCTYVGGSCASPYEGAFALSLDASGEVTLAGLTCSTDCPVTPGAFQPAFGGGLSDAFVARLAADGGALVYATYLGGTDHDIAWAMAGHGQGLVTVAGETDSTDFPTTPLCLDDSYNSIPGPANAGDAFVTRLDAGGQPLWSTYLGGNGNDHVHGITVDDAGVTTMCGSLSSTNFPTTPGAHDATRNGPEDGFVSRLSASGADLLYSTYLGGLLRSASHALVPIDVDTVLVSGPTQANDFPTTPGAYDTTVAGDFDAYVARLTLLPCAGVLQPYGAGCAGPGGLAPVLDGSGCAQSGATIWLPLRYLSPGGATAFLFVGLGNASVPTKGGCTLDVAPIVPQWTLVLPLPPTGPFGDAIPLPVLLPNLGTDVDVYLQYLLADAGAPSGVEGTNALHLHVVP